MEAVQSRRGRIMDALKAQLNTIIKGEQYSTTVYDVSFNVKNWYQKPEAETPVLYIIDKREVRKYGPGKTLEISWYIDIYGFMRNRTQEEMEEMIADIDKCLDLNRTLSFNGERGLVNHHRVTDIVTDNQMFAEIEGSQLFCISLEILYTRCVDDPR